MASLVERLRDRSDRKPLYNLDNSDDDFDFEEEVKKKKPRLTSSSRNEIVDVKKTQRPDVREGSCQACGKDDDILNCESCTYSYHPKCLFPPLRDPLPTIWKCPQCVGPLIDIDKILDCEMRPTAGDEDDASMQGSDQVPVNHYLVKWKGQSYLHCTWVPETEFINAYKLNPRLKIRVNNFRKQASSTDNMEDEYVAIRPEWTTVDRILACREGNEEKEYLVKWKELSYEECYWEVESDIATFHEEIEKFNRNKSRRGKASAAKQKSKTRGAVDSKQKQKEFQQYDSSPDFLSGGLLHPYQLDGLNFLRFSWSKQTHVILADEMGLGKTIQSIAFLASLLVENVAPHVVVAPLSTLRNWEREFSLWAPHMNVVMYVGSAQARKVIREYEFYYPKTQMKAQKKSKKKPNQTSNKSKQERIKFDVLLTSYEMINLDSASLKPIKWECMIVDEGHRLKNKDSKLFSMLTQFSSKHRVLLTGTPLQNNLDELFMLMHFLDAGKFESLEEFQNEFKDIIQEEQVSRLHSMLAPHLLRRMKKDVMKGLPPKRELILRVELSSKQKEYYKAILTRNYEILARKGGAQISLINVVMELRKLCCHPFMLEGVEPEDTKEFDRQLVECSGKLQLLDKMMVKLKEQGHRVLIYSQFQHMLNLLEDYCRHRKWKYERIDGTVGGVERQIRIDRFNAKNSSRFCFLLSTRAGGIGINLATADTVIIYDSDWNPHADLQAMARAHRLGQRNKVMIYRLVSRGTIEERMVELTKKKMLLEHVVVGKLKTQNINQDELDDIIKYGSKELFADDSDESVNSRIHYDAAAIDRLLDREQVGETDASLDDKEEDGFLKAFKVANFEYVDEVEAATEEESSVAQADNTGSTNKPEQANYWEDLLRDKYEVHKIEEFNAMGKGKRSRKQVVQVEEHDLAGFQDVSSDSGDDSYEVELADRETSTGATPAKKSNGKRTIDVEDIPLMEGEGKSLKVLGFNQSQRAEFVKIMMRFGAGDYRWEEFIPRLKKTFEEVHRYGKLFLEHLVEAQNNLPTFKDGVPKEGLKVPDVLARMGTMSNIFHKVKASTDGSVHFADNILSLYPPLRGDIFWTPKHDLLLLQAVLRHGFQKWQAIVDDKESGIQGAICQHLSIPVRSSSQPPHSGVGTSDQPQTSNLGGNENASGCTDHNAVPAHTVQDQPASHYTKEVLKRVVDFIKKRLWLLQKAMAIETIKENEAGEYNLRSAETGHNAHDANCPFPVGSSAQINNQYPPAETFSYDEVMAHASDQNPDRLKLAELYNKMIILTTSDAHDSIGPLESIFHEMNEILAQSSKEDKKTGAGSSAMDTDATVR